jgi:hypothetical protein
MGFNPVTVVQQQQQQQQQQDQTHRNTHILHKTLHDAQTKDSKQSYTNNKGHITHNEYNIKRVKLPP